MLAASTAGAGRPIASHDLLDFVWIGDPQISPDGTRVAFVRVVVDARRTGYESAIWTVPVSGADVPHPLTSGKHDAAPRWSPDGRYLAFERAQEKDGKPQPPQLWLLASGGGDSFPITDLPRGASHAVWSTDGTQIAFLSRCTADDLAKQAAARAPGAPAPGPTREAAAAESDVHVVTQAVYRTNAEGYIDFAHPEHVWLLTVPHSADDHPLPRPLTHGRFDDKHILWARDGKRVYFTSLHVDEPYYQLPQTELYVQGVDEGQAVKVATLPMAMGPPALSPDGAQLAFVAEPTRPVNSYSQPKLWVLDLAGAGPPRDLTSRFDWEVGASVLGDNAPPRAAGSHAPLWTADGRALIESYSKQGRTQLGLFEIPTGAERDLTSGDQAVLGFSGTSAGTLVYESSTTTRIGELFALDRAQAGAASRQLTRLNETLFAGLDVREPQEIWLKSFDGQRIQAWLQKPPDFDPRRKYPLILDIHGGPHTAYGFVFDHEFQWLAAKGYLVLYPNPRGSTSYGQAFGNIIQYRYPGDDFKDLMASVDEVVKQGYVDVRRLGVTGGSGGGLLTNWVIGHTSRFAAAVAQRDIADWADWWYSADVTLFQANWFRAPPFEDPADYRARSPITYVTRITTPLMLVLGESDTRTPTGAGGEQMFRALKYRHVPTVMVRFPEETHELSRSGQPRHRIERLEHIAGWFDHWLLGAPKPEYEPAPASP